MNLVTTIRVSLSLLFTLAIGGSAAGAVAGVATDEGSPPQADIELAPPAPPDGLGAGDDLFGLGAPPDAPHARGDLLGFRGPRDGWARSGAGGRFGRDGAAPRGPRSMRGSMRSARVPAAAPFAAKRERPRPCDPACPLGAFGSRPGDGPRHARQRIHRPNAGAVDCRLLAGAPPGDTRAPRADRPGRGGPPDRPWSRRARGEAPFDPEQFKADFERVRQFVTEHFPERLAELEEFQSENPNAARRRMAHMFPRVRRIMEMMERNPEVGELMIREQRLQFETQRLLDEYFSVNDSDRLNDLREKIRANVAEGFDVRIRLRTQEVERLERRLEVIRQQLGADAEHRDERIQMELHDLGVFDER